MARTIGPAMSFDASGSLGGAIVFSKWKGRNYIRSLVIPANPKSNKQVSVRSMMTWLTQQWANIPSANKNTWKDLADPQSISPFNAYVQHNQGRWSNFRAPTQAYPAAESTLTATAGTPTAQGGTRMATVTVPITSAGNGWGVMFYRSGQRGFSTAYDNLKHIGRISGTSNVVFVDSPLEPGTYYYNFRLISVDGTLGNEVGEVSCTVS
ncbi:hypothetical protein [uncultured Thermanaerothrix sp.]|uniref:hypothetical protein n=1 Tax=uncultured Thermanaerothrix sp. TaxID=1195149 RepID=UPI002619F14C|nr:hypothetical protein [uncultured Thermanaerothrix sp.]